MKINEKILSIPPHLSVSWYHVASIKMKGKLLSITLNDNETIHIPGLSEEIIRLIFKLHAEHIENTSIQELSLRKNSSEPEKKQISMLSKMLLEGQNQNSFPLKFGFAAFDGINAIAEHNPAEMDAPDLPSALLDKLSLIAKIIAPEDALFLPKEISGCNCFHCQITRAIHQNLSREIIQEIEQIEEEIVSDHELTFSQWNVVPNGENLFKVINKLDQHEHYRVYLGTPVGCNCGEPNCEHIIAALKT